MVYVVYEADDSYNSVWLSEQSAAELCANHPGWYYAAERA